MSEFKVYFRKDDKSIGQISVETDDNHHEAIVLVQEMLVKEGTGYNNPVLVLIDGGKKNE